MTLAHAPGNRRRNLARHDERRPSGEQPDKEEQTADGFNGRGENDQAGERRPGGRKAKEFIEPGLKEKQRYDNAQ